MKPLIRILQASALGLTSLAVSVPAQADFLNLRDGTTLEGIFEGASARNMHFRVDGIVRQVPLKAVKGLELSPRPEAEALSSISPDLTQRYMIVGQGNNQAIQAESAVN